MAQSKKGKLNYRCPCCFMRDLDIDMFYDEQNEEYYCLRCGYHGDETDVLNLNNQARFKYKMINKRVVSFNEDNQKLVYEVYKK